MAAPPHVSGDEIRTTCTDEKLRDVRVAEHGKIGGMCGGVIGKYKNTVGSGRQAVKKHTSESHLFTLPHISKNVCFQIVAHGMSILRGLSDWFFLAIFRL